MKNPMNQQPKWQLRGAAVALCLASAMAGCGDSGDGAPGDGDGDGGDGDTMTGTSSGGSGAGDDGSGGTDATGGLGGDGATGGTGAGGGTGGDGGHPPLDNSYCSTPGWENALPHAENVVVPATFVDGGEKQVLAEYDIEASTMEELEAAYPLVVTVSAQAGADYVTDGVDDHIEINQATDQVFKAGGGLVYLEAGTYTVNDSIYVWDNTTLKGAGRIGARRTVIVLADDAPTMSGQSGIVRVKKDFEVGALKRVVNATIEDFVIDGNRAGQAVIPESADGVVPATYPDQEKKYGYYAEGDNILAQRVTVMNCMGYGFDPHQHEDTLMSTVTIQDCYSFGNLNDGFTLDALYDVVIAHNVSRNNDRHGFNIVTGTQNITVCGSLSYDNGLPPEGEDKGVGSGIQIQNGSDPATPIPNTIFLLGNSLWGNGKSGIDLRKTYNSYLTDNYVTGSGDYGIRLRDADNNFITGNIVEYNSAISGTAYEIVMGDYDDLVNPIGGSDNNEVTGNTFRNISGRHVREEPTGMGNNITDNTLEF